MFPSIHDPKLVLLYCGVLFLLVISTLIGGILKRRHRAGASRTTIDNLNARIRAWWKMCVIFAVAILIGRVGSLILFGIISFLAMREYMTLVPTRRGDHRTLFWSFFVIMPLQYYLIGIQWYGFFAIMIPVLAFVFVPASIAIAGDTEHFLERAAKIQFGIMVCAYCLSHARRCCC
jgi:phosphatidate cytidylyltransferase